MDFVVFLKRNQAYKSICDGFSELFNLLFVTALGYRHQIDLHLIQVQSNLLDEKKQQLSSCMEDILSRIEKPYASDVQAAFNAFKDRHKNDKPACSLSEFQGLLEAFLIMVETQKNLPPPPTGTTESFYRTFFFNLSKPNTI